MVDGQIASGQVVACQMVACRLDGLFLEDVVERRHYDWTALKGT